MTCSEYFGKHPSYKSGGIQRINGITAQLNYEGVVYYNLAAKWSDMMQTKIMLASASIPFVFPKEQIGNHFYSDGCMTDNLPTCPLYMHEKCDIIIAVRLKRRPCRKRNVKITGTKIIDVYPSKSLGGFLGTLDFSSSNVKKRIALGYEDAMKALFPVMECIGENEGIIIS